jgi:amino acid transporter
MGGKWLGALLSFAGMASMLGIFIAVLLSVSRVPAVMGKDRLLPAVFTRTHSKYQTPYISIIVCAAVVSFLVMWPLGDLLVIDIALYGAGLSLEFIALIHLRKKAPGFPRPFKIPFQKNGLIILYLAPLLVFTVAMGAALLGSGQSVKPAIFAIAAIVSAQGAWMVVKLKIKK